MRPVKRDSFTTETALILLAFVLALSLRLGGIGAFPLSEQEASQALQAYDLSSGRTSSTESQPAYILLTGILFGIFKDTNATARFFPALAGSLLVFLPLLFKSLWGNYNSSWRRWGGLIFAFGVALDPGLVAASRMAGGPMMGLSFTLLAAGFIWRGRADWAGLLAGLGLMSGPGVVQGLVGLGVAIFLFRLLFRNAISIQIKDSFAFDHLSDWRFWRRLVVFAGGTILFGGLLWLQYPQGLSGLAQLLPGYLAGWVQPSGVPAFRLPVSLLLYQPLAVVFGLVGVIRAWLFSSPHHNTDRLLSLWVLSALILSIIYPGRQVVDAIWVLIPLWFLAATELSQHIAVPADSKSRLASLGQAGAITLFLVIIWINLTRLDNLNAQPLLYVAIIGGSTLMMLITVVLVSMGWGLTPARLGLVWGVSLIMGVYVLSAMWGVSQVRPNNPTELWTITPGTGQEDLLLETLQDLSAWQYGMEDEIVIQTDLESASLRWALRDFPKTSYAVTPAFDQQPDVLLTSQTQNEPALQASYRGQELVWSRSALWNGVLPPNLLRWLTYRELPTAPNSIILWARVDLFPGELIMDNQASNGSIEAVP